MIDSEYLPLSIIIHMKILDFIWVSITQFAFILESDHSSNLMLCMFLIATTCLANS